MTPFPLVDLQVNGYHGVNFSAPDLQREQVIAAAGYLASDGTAAFLATLVSPPLATLHRNIALLAELGRGALNGRLLGIHLEGPFIAPDVRVLGVHRQAHVEGPTAAALGALLDAGGDWVRMVTLAAEMPGSDALIRLAAARGVVVAIGHSWALAPDLRRAVAAGATALTHLGNALPPELPKHNNPLLSGLLNRDLVATVIADGHHLSPELLALVIRAKGPRGVLLVSDAAPVAGLRPGRYRAFAQDVELTQAGAVVNHAEGHLAGSGASLLACLNVVVASGEATPTTAAAMASTGPLDLLGLATDDLDPASVRVCWSAERERFEVAA